MQVMINGQPESHPASLTVAELLSMKKLEPIRVAVEINEQIVPRKTFADTQVKNGDQIEIVTFVGGG